MNAQNRNFLYFLHGEIVQTYEFVESFPRVESAYEHFINWLAENPAGLVYESLFNYADKKPVWYVNFYVGGSTKYDARKIEAEELPEVLRVQLLVGAI